MTATLSLSDPIGSRFDTTRLLDGFADRFLNDRRDLPFVFLSLRMLLVLVPCAVALFAMPEFPWWIAPMYWAVVFGLFFDRYILMLHNTSHRTLYRRSYRHLNKIIPWVLGPFCGQSPDTYYIHHITMHHAEGNLPDDLSSTMKYQRDSFRDFMRYFARFFFFGLWDMSRYQLRRNRPHLTRRVLAGELSFLAMVGIGLWLNWQATLVVFLTPYLIARFLMMCGNWGQHAFVDPSDPGNSYRNSITCINCGYNRRCFNDGYHIGHHVTANRHWTEMPGDLERNLEIYRQNDAVIFKGIDFFIVWFLLMTKNYRRLVKQFVDLNEVPRTPQQVEALLRRRTARILV